jgi:hypothetical protein
MKSILSRPAVLLAALFVSPALTFAEPTVGAPVQAHGGQNGARGRTLDDLELTALTRAEESYLPQLSAVATARAELLKASLSAPTTVAAKAQAMATAELALALSRADAYAKLKVQLKSTTPARNEAIMRALNDATANTGGGRGGAPAAAAPAAAPARGN